MLIDWFTVIAQAVNFLILVWLLKRFLYKPILAAIDAREARIATELADAAQKKTEAQKDRDDFQHKNETFDHDRTALMATATNDAKAERQRLFDDAHKAADADTAATRLTMLADAAALRETISRRVQQEVFSIARKTLSDLGGISIEERMSDVFIQRLKDLAGRAKDCFSEALKESHDPAMIRTPFELPSPQRNAIQQAINDAFAGDIRLRFETTPDLIGGIEFTTYGEKLAWNITDYLQTMEKSIGDLLKKDGKPGAQSP